MSGFALGALASPGTTHPPQPPTPPSVLTSTIHSGAMTLPTTPLQGSLEKIPLAPFYPPFFARGRPATSVTSTRRVPRSGPRREDYSTDRNRWQSRKSTPLLRPTRAPTRGGYSSNIVTPSGSPHTFLYLLVSHSAPIVRAQDKGARIWPAHPPLVVLARGRVVRGPWGWRPLWQRPLFHL